LTSQRSDVRGSGADAGLVDASAALGFPDLESLQDSTVDDVDDESPSRATSAPHSGVICMQTQKQRQC